MSKVSARKGLKSAQVFKARASGRRLVVLPKPKKSWLLAGTALVTGVVGGLTLLPNQALATCTIDANVINCSGTFTGNGFDFAPGGDFDVNVLGSNVPANVAHITGDQNNNPTLDITAGGNDGYFTFEEGTTFIRSGEDGGDEHVIRINGGEALNFVINGGVWNEDTSSGSATLQFNGGTASTIISMDIGSTGLLGDNSSELIIDVNADIGTTVINNWGEMNGRMDFTGGSGAVTINNYGVDTWNTSGVNDFTNNDDLINNEGGTLNTDGFFSIFYLKEGDDTLRNTEGGNITTTSDGLGTYFFFDNPDFCSGLGLIVCAPVSGIVSGLAGTPLGSIPFAFTEDGDQGDDTLENTKGSTFTTNDATFFFFGGGNDQLLNSKGADFFTNDNTVFGFGTGDDALKNFFGATFNTSGQTDFFFDNPETDIGISGSPPFIEIAGVPFTEDGQQGMDVLKNFGGATFNSGAPGGGLDITSFYFGGNDDKLWNAKGATFNTFDISTFAFGSGDDEMTNTKGADFNATGLTTFFFDNPDVIDLFGVTVPVPFTENGSQGNDVFENSKGATFNAGVVGGIPDITSFFFGGYSDTFKNEKGATFNANDLTIFSFGSGDDTFWNRWGGTLNVNGVTEFFFGDDYDVAYNYATINVNGLLNFWDLETFYNSGSGYGGIIDMRNGDVLPDVTSIFGPGLGAGDFIGGYGSRLGVDVFFGPPLPSFPFGYSDLLVIGGGIYGETAILIDKLNPEPGGFNPVGIDVVLYSSGATIEKPCGPGPCQYGNAFYISPDSPDYIHVGSSGAIEDGLFAWFLFQDEAGPGGDFELRGLGGPGAVNAPGIVTGAQNIFYDTLSVVEDHSYGHQFGNAGGAGADLPIEDAAVAATGDGGTRAGLWAKVSGSWTERDTSVTESMVTYDTGSSQEIYSVLGGADMKPWGADSAVRLGLFGGYVTSSLDFDLGTTSADYEGGVVGGYAAYNDGAFYADVTVKGDILDTEYSFAGVDVDADVTNIGVAGNTGYRMRMGAGFVEPIASIAYVHSDVDDFTGGGGTVSFSENDSLRAGAGARIGATFATGGGTTELAVLGRVWNEFEEANEVTVTDGVGSTTTFSDDIEGIFGEVQATATMSNASKTLSAFVSGGGMFGEDFTSWNARAGVRAGF